MFAMLALSLFLVPVFLWGIPGIKWRGTIATGLLFAWTEIQVAPQIVGSSFIEVSFPIFILCGFFFPTANIY